MDRKILAELQRDGRLTITELAARVQLSVSPCHRRLRDLERRARSAATGRSWTTDLAAFQHLYDEQLAGLPGVQRLTSTLVMKHVVEDRPLPG
ncbi:Lrp/AsnC family transcriptional regulator [Streptomyces sp. gb1(2016)]|nr:AsnC family transcriptional regulator [Streptomyces sp. gb1(2016)]